MSILSKKDELRNSSILNIFDNYMNITSIPVTNQKQLLAMMSMKWSIITIYYIVVHVILKLFHPWINNSLWKLVHSFELIHVWSPAGVNYYPLYFLCLRQMKWCNFGAIIPLTQVKTHLTEALSWNTTSY